MLRNIGKRATSVQTGSAVLRKTLSFASAILCCGILATAQEASQSDATTAARATATESSSPLSQGDGNHTLRISGRVVDPTGVPVAGARVELRGGTQLGALETQTAEDGQFLFANPAAGPFRLSVSAAGFTAQEISGTASQDQGLELPPITLALATVNTAIKVVPPEVIAEAQIKEEEKQRALGFIPNYYVSYVPNAQPLVPRQKFELAWKSMVDPVTFGITGAVAGIQQAQNYFSGYGQGADGYAKRYGAAYADSAISTIIGSAILPSLLHQDPRYFYKGTGSKKSRLMYALANSVICKGDSGKWQLNYSALGGNLAAGGISNLYYPASDRDAGLTFQNFAIGIGAAAAANVLQEFVIKRLTPSANKSDPTGNTTNTGSAANYAVKPLNSIAHVFGKMVREGD